MQDASVEPTADQPRRGSAGTIWYELLPLSKEGSPLPSVGALGVLPSLGSAEEAAQHIRERLDVDVAIQPREVSSAYPVRPGRWVLERQARNRIASRLLRGMGDVETSVIEEDAQRLRLEERAVVVDLWQISFGWDAWDFRHLPQEPGSLLPPELDGPPREEGPSPLRVRTAHEGTDSVFQVVVVPPRPRWPGETLSCLVPPAVLDLWTAKIQGEGFRLVGFEEGVHGAFRPLYGEIPEEWRQWGVRLGCKAD